MSVSLPVVVESDHRVPVVDLVLTLRTGTAIEPRSKAGLTRLAWLLVRSGTRRVPRTEMTAELDRLGARWSVTTSLSYVQHHLSMLASQADDTLSFFSEVLRRPALRAKDLAFHKRDLQASRHAARDNYKVLAARAWMRALYGKHAYGRSVSGTERSNKATAREDLRRHLDRCLVADNLVLGLSGDVEESDASAWIAKHFDWLPSGKPPRDATPRPASVKRVAAVVELPELTQVHLYLGTLGARIGERDYEPWMIATTAFGGTFSSRLSQQVREKHGYSYEVSARLGAARQRSTWSMYSYPSAQDFAACLALQLKMSNELFEGGVRSRELGAVRRHLLRSECFERETALKRLEPRLDEVVYDLPSGWYAAESQRLRSVGVEDVRAVVRRRLNPARFCLAAVGPPGTRQVVEDIFGPSQMLRFTPEQLTR